MGVGHTVEHQVERDADAATDDGLGGTGCRGRTGEGVTLRPVGRPDIPGSGTRRWRWLCPSP
ncbi:hypothetical protein ABH925_000378 [Streptacidiphilus sp. EB129]